MKMDGMRSTSTAGYIPLLLTGLAYVIPGTPVRTSHELQQLPSYNLMVFGAGVGEIGKVLCGAPVVSCGREDDGHPDGEVIGFFFMVCRGFYLCARTR